jgi:lysyl endopeptidase
MRIKPMKWIARVLAGLAAAALPALAQFPVVSGEPALAPKAVAAPQLRLAPGAAAGVVLSPITDNELAPLRQANQRSRKRHAIGVTRALAGAALPSARDLPWRAVEAGSAAQAAVTSPGAGAMRISIDLAGVPEDVEMTFFGSDRPERLLGPVRVGEIRDRATPWWSPLTDGETQTVEFFVPGANDPRSSGLGIAGVSHVVAPIAGGMAKQARDIGKAGSCNIDIQCSALKGSQAFLNARNAVAETVFNDGGAVYMCSGQLLADTDASTQIPWFYSANHCFDNPRLPYKTPAQMQSVADTLNTLWFFEARSCGDLSVPSYSQLYSGATLVYNSPGSDVLFVRLNGAPPAGAYYAGWNANPIGAGESIVVMHHPEGDLKKVSQGSVLRYSAPQPSIPGGATTAFTEVHYTSGTTEGGSSGGGLWTFDGVEYRLRGGLYGGGAYCATPNESDWYSQLDKAYPALAPYLDPSAGSASIDYSDLWWNANESGWGLSISQHASRNIFAIWYTYGDEGKPAWFTVPGGTWTSATTFTGSVYATSGPPANAPAFNPNQVKVSAVGTATLTFSDANHGTWAYNINGVSAAKSITRQPY